MFNRAILFLLIFIFFSKVVWADEQCKTLSMNEYAKIIHENEKTDVLMGKQKMPDNILMYEPIIQQNCYVRMMVYFKGTDDYVRNYLFDKNNELVDISLGKDLMTCKSFVHNNLVFFDGLLGKYRQADEKLPPKLKLPMISRIFVNGCLISYHEAFQDDPKKPLLEREWVFDHNGHIVTYGNLKRNSQIYEEDTKDKFKK